MQCILNPYLIEIAIKVMINHGSVHLRREIENIPIKSTSPQLSLKFHTFNGFRYHERIITRKWNIILCHPLFTYISRYFLRKHDNHFVSLIIIAFQEPLESRAHIHIQTHWDCRRMCHNNGNVLDS